MKRRALIGSLTGVSVSCGLAKTPPSRIRVKIHLDPDHPANSFATMGELRFPVGMGRDGTTPSGKAFQPGRSLLGRFEVSAILTRQRFEMKDEPIRQSGKTKTWLRENLFSNMSAIDFDGDGKGNEYGDGFAALSPIDSTALQPFHFGVYRGVFRWYSYAIHGTHDESRIGKQSTGGCINVGKEHLASLIAGIKLGDLVLIE